MRVLHVSPYFAPAFHYGGPPRSILGLCQGLQQNGVDVEVITIAADGAPAAGERLDESRAYEGVPVQYLPPAFPRRFFGGRLRAPLVEALSRADICHVHGIWNVPEWSATRLARSASVPYVLSPRGMLLPAAFRRGRWRKRLAFELMERRALERAALLHATSSEEAASLESLIPHVPVAMIPNGVRVDLADGAPAGAAYRRQLAIPDTAVVIAFLGRLHPIKRLDLLAAAFATLRARGRDVHLVLAGPDEGALADGLAETLRADGDRLHLVGPVEGAAKAALLSAADVGVQCSDSESFGMSVAEFLSAGTPVVVTRTCPWQVIDREGCGLWVEQSAAAMAEALDALVLDPSRRSDMGRRAALFAAARFSWRAIGRQMLDRYVSMASAPRTQHAVLAS